MQRIKIVHAVATVVRMEIGGVEHVVTKMSDEQVVREVAMERLCEELVASYFTQHLHHFPVFVRNR